MKKIILSACALSAMFLTSCSNEVDMFETIGTPKGTLNVDCIYDTEMTRGSQSAATDSWTWVIKANETELQEGDNSIAEGTYTVTASNYADLTAALAANKDDNEKAWGDAFYSGSQEGVKVTKGQSKTVSIYCGRAQNARLKTTFNFNSLESFTDVKLIADIDVSEPSHIGRKLEFNTTTPTDKFAYFEANKTIKCKLSYTFNSTTSTTSTTQEKTFNFTLAGPATENVIDVKTNNNGTITISLTNITYEEEFGTGNSEEITIDAATGTVL